LTEIREREQAATPGPWVVGVRESWGWPVFAIRDMTGPTKAEEMADAEFIQEARADVPYLLGVVERLTDENQALRLGAIQDEGLWSSQDAGLRAEVTRLTAERDALRAAGQSVTARCRTWVSWRDSEGVERCDVCNEPTTAHNPTCPAALIWQEPTKEATDGK